jgi:hypothetical protein
MSAIEEARSNIQAGLTKLSEAPVEELLRNDNTISKARALAAETLYDLSRILMAMRIAGQTMTSLAVQVEDHTIEGTNMLRAAFGTTDTPTNDIEHPYTRGTLTNAEQATDKAHDSHDAIADMTERILNADRALSTVATELDAVYTALALAREVGKEYIASRQAATEYGESYLRVIDYTL